MSIDPGFTTGYMVAEVEKNSSGIYELVSIIKQDIFKYDDPTGVLQVVIFAKHCDVIVIEDFITRPEFYGQKNYSDRVIGLFEIFHHNKEIVFQQPTQKQQCSDDQLRSLDLYTKSIHVRDATRHFVIWLHKRQKKKFKTVRRWPKK